MKKIGLNATSLRTLLVITFLIIASSTIGGFYYAHDWLKRFAAESNINIMEPTTSGAQSVSQSQTAYSQKVNLLTLNSSDYFEKIKIDLNKYATDNRLTVNINETSQDVINGLNDQVISGIQSKFITVSFGGPVNFNDLLKFINGVETSLPKIKIMGINISRVSNSAGMVTVSPITMKVYAR